MPKNQVGSFVSILIVIGLLNLLFTYFLCCYLCVMRLYCCFFLLIGILLLRPYESIKTSDSY
ncbi:hypothetical protein RchiOBHm_CPg0501951 (chloroplast) [Rosa chinensis]|uniref:Uncharacterized protein n=1 Tax=Rosa chinensis TaxID=74649 RepID=A0A2P6P178_ROSCH|nr:hypothetical protein RchiOBHm_CPg0501951 [Rosa chinensis]